MFIALRNSWLQKAWKKHVRIPHRSRSNSRVHKVYPEDEVVDACMVSTRTTLGSSSLGAFGSVAISSPEDSSMTSIGTEGIPLSGICPEANRKPLQLEPQQSSWDVTDAVAVAEKHAGDAVADATMLATGASVAHSAGQAMILPGTAERDMQRTMTGHSHASNRSVPRSPLPFISQDVAMQESLFGGFGHAPTDAFVGSNHGHAQSLLSVIPDSGLDNTKIAGKCLSCRQSSAAAVVIASSIRQDPKASVGESRRLQATTANEASMSMPSGFNARTNSLDRKNTVLNAMEASIPKPAWRLHRAETPETVHTTESSLARTSDDLVDKVCSSSPHRTEILNTASMHVTQDVSNLPKVETSTCSEPSLCSVADILPPLSAVACFQGAWELIDQNQKPDNWLRSFIITGRYYFAGDGSENCLRLSTDGASILMEGGALSIDGGRNILTRTGKSGKVLRFQPFELPTEEIAEEFQGVWRLSSIMAGSRSWRPAAWLFNLKITGRVWKAGYQGGILKLAHGGAVCLHANYDIWLEQIGDEDILFLAISNHMCLQYRLVANVPYPWHRT